MYKIALCDDKPEELDKIEKLLTAYHDRKPQLEYRIKKYGSAKDLLCLLQEEGDMPDLLFLDIFMPEMTGMELAEKLRQSGNYVPVIFLTTSTEYALDAYSVDAIQYLVKPLEQKRFFHVMDFVFQMIWKRQEEQIVIKVVSGIRKLYPDEIIYSETRRNYQILYLKSEECQVRMSSGELYGMLERFPQFERCGRSYILNMNHIISVNKEEIRMDNSSKIYIPRSKIAEFQKLYFTYYFGE